MGFFFSSNYTPADFKGKAIKEITAMDPKKVDKDFLTKYAAEINEGEKALSEKQKSAIQLLIDLSDKSKIFENCYDKKVTPQPQAQPQQEVMQLEPEEDDEEQAEQTQAERAQEVKFPERDERALVQGGGRRKSKRSSRHSSRRSSRRSSRVSKRGRKSKKGGKKSKRTKRGGRKSKRGKTSKRSSKRKTRKY
jgi:hypothetical protein